MLLGAQSIDLDVLPVTVVRGACWPDFGGALVRVKIAARAWGNRGPAWWPESARMTQNLVATAPGVAVPWVKFYNEWLTSYWEW